MIRAPAEADAPARLDNEGPATTYLSVTVFPAVTGSPRGTGEVPRCAGGASPCAQSSCSASFVPTKFKKGRAWALADHFLLPAITGLHGLRMRKQLDAGQDASSRCDKRRDCWRTAGERTRVRTHKLNEKLG